MVELTFGTTEIDPNGVLYFLSPDGEYMSLEEMYLLNGTLEVNAAIMTLINLHNQKPIPPYISLDTVISNGD